MGKRPCILISTRLVTAIWVACMLMGCGDSSAPPSPTANVVQVAAPAAAPKTPPVVVADVKTFREDVTAFLKQHCIECHGPEKQKGKLRLDTLEADFINNPHAATWTEVVHRLNLG